MSREQLSTLMDGEGDFRLQSAQAVTFVRQVASDEASRRDWLMYAQIGDVLRSSDLTPLPNEHDFLQRVSAAIAREPIVLQPQVSAKHDAAQSVRAATHRRPHWSTRMTAGMAAVAGVAVMAWVALPGLQQTEQQGVRATAVRPVVASTGALASSHSAQVGVPGLIPTNLSAQAAPGTAQVIPVSAQMPMVEYLLAHQQMAGGMMPVVPATLRVVAERSAVPSALSH
jgi:sigma-E factor negative regulatory protein RseA